MTETRLLAGPRPLPPRPAHPTGSAHGRLAGRPWSPRHAPGQWNGAILAVLVIITTVEVRSRDAVEALEDPADTAVLVELALWALAGAWIGSRLLADRWLLDHFPHVLGGAMRWLLVIGLVATLSALLVGSAFGVVRAVQLLILLALGALVQRDTRAGRTTVATVWAATAYTVVIAVAVLVVVSAVVPDQVRYAQEDRYRILETHPIGTGQLLGLGVLACAAAGLLRWPKPRRAGQRLLLLAGVGFASALWATAARGVLAGTVLALVVLVVLAPRSPLRSIAVLGGAVLTAAAASGLVDAALTKTLVRGQTQDQLASLSGRTELFQYGLQLFNDRPLIGHGYVAGRTLFLERFPWAGESHNAIVEIAVSLGLTGLVLYTVLILTVLAAVAAGVRQPGRRAQVALIVAMLCWLSADATVADSFAGPVGPGVLVLLLVALLADDLRPSRRATSTQPRIIHPGTTASWTTT